MKKTLRMLSMGIMAAVSAVSFAQTNFTSRLHNPDMEKGVLGWDITFDGSDIWKKVVKDQASQPGYYGTHNACLESSSLGPISFIKSLIPSNGEKGTDRSVDNTRSKDSVLGRSALASVPAAGDLTCGVKSFLVIYREGKEVDAVSGSGRHGCVCKHCGFTVANQAGAACQLCELAGFDNQRSACELIAECFKILEHFSFFLSDF